MLKELSFLSLVAIGAPLLAELPTVGDDPAQRAMTEALVKSTTDKGPGCVIGVDYKGRSSFAARGMASVEWQQPLTQFAVFDIASNSKQFTAAIIYQLEAEGKIDLGKPAGTYLPLLKGKAADATIRQLLSHTSGIRDLDSLRMLTRTQDETTPTTDDALAAIYSQTSVNFDPGSDFAYSNSNYILLARIAELIDGKPFVDILKQRIAEPLGLPSTIQRGRYDEVIPLRATAYGRTLAAPGIQAANWTLIGTSSVQSNAPDLLRWLGLLSNAEGPTGYLAKVLEPGRLQNGQAIAYAGGLVRDQYRGVVRYTHNGGSAGFRSTLAVFPGQRLAVVVLCNSSAIFPNLVADEVAGRLLPEPASAPAGDLVATAMTGIFYDSGVDAIRWVERSAEGLRVKSSPGDRGRLFRPSGRSEFTDQFNNTAKLHQDGVELDDGLRFMRKLSPVPNLDENTFPPEALGTYASKDLDIRLTLYRDSESPIIRLEPTEAFMRASDSVERRLTPAPTGAFMTANGWIVRFPKPGAMTITLGRLIRYPLKKVGDSKVLETNQAGGAS